MPHARLPASAQKGRAWRGVHPLAAGRTRESDARMGDHPSSPPSSASRIAATSSIENTRSPQPSLSRAMMSGLGADRVVEAAANEVSWAKGRPRFRICTVSPCSIQDDTFLKRLRRSVTDAVFTGDATYHEAVALQGFMPCGESEPWRIAQRRRSPPPPVRRPKNGGNGMSAFR